MRKWMLPVVLLIVAILAIGLTWAKLSDRSAAPERAALLVTPDPTPTPESSVLPSPPAASSAPKATPSLSSPKSTPSSSVSSVRLSVPFTIQAPDSEWVEPWDDGCEEAALLMVDAYLKGSRESTLPVAETKQKIKTMVDWQVERFGGHKDLGLADIAAIAKENMGYRSVRIEEQATFDDIRAELRAGHPVILPAAGQRLSNPHFTQPGPPYHVFVVTGFEGNNFIANENGTRQGKNYVYSEAVLDAAWHDLIDGVSIENGPRSFLVLER